MSADLLREAADQVRANWSLPEPNTHHGLFCLAVADWLDAIVTRIPEIEPQYEHLLDREQSAALAVARAYLGDPS